MITQALYILAGLMLLVSACLLVLNSAGFKVIILQGHSMEPTYESGALLLAQRVDPTTVQVGDVISFEDGGDRVVHRVVSVQSPYAVTKGDNNPVIDPNLAVLNNAYKVIWRLR